VKRIIGDILLWISWCQLLAFGCRNVNLFRAYVIPAARIVICGLNTSIWLCASRETIGCTCYEQNICSTSHVHSVRTCSLRKDYSYTYIHGAYFEIQGDSLRKEALRIKAISTFTQYRSCILVPPWISIINRIYCNKCIYFTCSLQGHFQ
jgi:hypothetical protein